LSLFGCLKPKRLTCLQRGGFNMSLPSPPRHIKC
jgi:hypothetical protein